MAINDYMQQLPNAQFSSQNIVPDEGTSNAEKAVYNIPGIQSWFDPREGYYDITAKSWVDKVSRTKFYHQGAGSGFVYSKTGGPKGTPYIQASPTDYLTLDPTITIPLGGDWSCAFYSKPGGTNDVLLSSTPAGFALLFDASIPSHMKLRTDLSADSYTSSGDVTPNAWIYTMVSYRSADKTLRFYLNGALDATRNVTDANDATTLRFLSNADGSIGFSHQLSEMITFTSDLSSTPNAANLTTLNSYFTGKFT